MAYFNKKALIAGIWKLHKTGKVIFVILVAQFCECYKYLSFKVQCCQVSWREDCLVINL